MNNQPMTGDELRDAQDALDMDNKRFTDVFGVSEATLCNWKADRTKVPAAVAIALRLMIATGDNGATGSKAK
jgi:DNA-binding transcriptional regulator YiaG